MADQAGAQGFGEWAAYVGGGALIGGLSGGAAAGVSALGGGAMLAGAAAGAVRGMAGSAVAMPIQSFGNTAYFGDPMMTGKQYLLGIGIGTLLGGTVNGTIALFNGKTFFTGDLRGTGIPTPGPGPTLKLNDPEVKINTEGLRTKINPMPDEGLYVLDDARTAVQFDIEGVKMQYIRDPNFRSNLISASGINPTDAVAHHVFPMKYSYNFRKLVLM